MKEPDLINRCCRKLHFLSGWLKVLLIIFVFIIFSNSKVIAQIQPDYSVVEGVDPVTLVQQILIGQGVSTSNITYTGFMPAQGSFSGQSNLGISTGVILTSGKAVNSVGPNNSASKGFDNSASGDSDLNILSGGSTEDASVLEFDFIPQSNIVEFRYVFGSDEYPEYANSSYNDVFGFFISGPGISGNQGYTNDAKNIAIAPVLAIPPIYVSINNINNGTSNNGPCENCQFYVNNGTGTTPAANPYIQYDGFTTVMVASSVVIPCETYHIKLVVADIGDGSYDSGVFLEANSFSSVGLAADIGFTHAAVDTAVEACNNAEVAFELFEIATLDYPISLEIGGTAENGVDYEFIEDQIVIPMGDTMAILNIIPIEDGIYEYVTETVTLIFNSSICGVDMDTLTVYIKDYPILGSVASGDQTIVCGESRKLQATGYGGIPPYYYQWDTGETTDTLRVSPAVTTTYTVTITDECGSQKVETIEVVVQGPVANAGDDIPICLNESVNLVATGGTSWLWQPGGYTDQTITVTPLTTTTYTLTVFDECGNSSTDEVIIYVDEPFADAGDDEDICVGQEVTLTANDTPGGTWTWTDMATMATYNGRTITVTPSDSRQYCVEVTDNCGNTLTDCLFVNVFQLSVEAGTNPTICAGSPADLTGTSSTGSGVFTWTDGVNTYTGPTVQVTPGITTTYTLTVDDGCIATDQVTVYVNPLPVVSATTSSGSICPDDQVTLHAAGAVSYVWTASPPDPTLTGQENNPDPLVSPLINTNYTVVGTDANGCENSSISGVTVKDRMFADFTVSGAETCEGAPLEISYAGNGQHWATYDWDFDGGATSTTGQGPHSVTWTGPGDRNISLTVTQSGCISQPVSLQVKVNALPVAGFSAGLTEGCIPLTVSFTDLSLNTVAGATYRWDFGGTASSDLQNPAQEFTGPGKYDVSLIVTNPGNCSSRELFTDYVDAWPVPQASFEANPWETSMKNPVIAFTSTSPGDTLTYFWNTGDGNTYSTPEFTHTYADSGYYRVHLAVTNPYGCIGEFENQVFVSPRYMLRIPSAFTPNGDGVNDQFTIKGNGVKKFSISIYNRWGALIFFSDNIDVSWDGSVNGEPADRGIYLYRTYFMDDNDEVSEQTGYINLLK